MVDMQNESDDVCWTAIKEAADAIQAKCGKSSNSIMNDQNNSVLNIPEEI